MKIHRLYLPVLLLLGFFCLISLAGSAPLSKDLLGIPPEDAKYFESDVIKCKDGSKKFTKAQLNDDFCDCPDGTDEPGTSACPGGKFYCQNAGHTPLLLFSSRVNDDICDCCDGSDEYDGRVNCPNTCWEAGKVARDRLKKKIATYQEGVSIRKQEVQKAIQAIVKDEAELSKLKSEEKILKGLVQQLKDRKEQIEKAEEKERLDKEKEEKRIRDSDEKADEQEKHFPETQHDENHDSIGLLDEPSLEQDVEGVNDVPAIEAGKSDNAENEASPSHGVEQEKDGSDSTEGLSRQELGRLVASRWTGENAGEQTKEDGAKEEEHEESQETHESAHDDYDGYSSETDENDHKYDEDEMEDDDVDDAYGEDHDDSNASYKPDSEDETDFSDITTATSPSWLDKIQQTVRNILQAVNLFQTPVDKSEAARVRKEYDESSAKLSKIQSRISSLEQKLKHDFGMEKEFYSFYDRCFESKQNKYVYKVCSFKQASQVEGHSTTQLGHWEKFEDSYRVMLFSNGDKCWHGPDRSLKVRLRCGLKNELTDVNEPSRCEYIAILSTPALCVEERLKELQHKLDLMNSEQPHSHEEL